MFPLAALAAVPTPRMAMAAWRMPVEAAARKVMACALCAKSNSAIPSPRHVFGNLMIIPPIRDAAPKPEAYAALTSEYRQQQAAATGRCRTTRIMHTEKTTFLMGGRG